MKFAGMGVDNNNNNNNNNNNVTIISRAPLHGNQFKGGYTTNQSKYICKAP